MNTPNDPNTPLSPRLPHDSTFTRDLQAVWQNAPHLVLVLDADFIIVVVNDALLRATQRTRSDLVGKSVFAAFPDNRLDPSADGHKNLRRSLERVLATGTSDKMPMQRYDLRRPAEEGGVFECRYWNVVNYPVLDAAGRVRCIVHQSEDVTEHLVVTSETQRRIYEAALSNTPDLIYVFDLQHRFVYANEALLSMWGKTREQALGRTCIELGYEPWHAEMHDRELEQVVATRQAVRGEVPFTGTGGRRIYDYIFVPVIGAHGGVVAVAGTTRDVTERRQAEQAVRDQAEQLRAADRTKDEFLATLAHELRNPLAPIANSLEILKRASGNAELAARARATAERQVRHLVRLVDDLLDVSRITLGRMNLRKQRILLSSIVEQAVESCRAQVEAGAHTLEVTLPPAPVALDADAVRLVQVLCNLLNNAAKYTLAGGRIELRAIAFDSHVEIKVRDTGIGIEPEMIGQVFDMFTRADHSLERSQDGLGIGLTLAKRLIEMHGGSIEAHSPGLGHGSEFVVKLPILASAA